MNSIVNDKLREKILFKTLDSGLKVYYIPKPGFTKKYAIFSTNYGSIDNSFVPIGEDKEIIVPEGIAHFLEHKLFEEEGTSIFDQFSKYGAQVNAYTNFNNTSYLFYTTEHFYESLDLLVKFVQSPYLTDENVEKEKGIIAQEIKMYQDNPKWNVYFNSLRTMYVNHPVKIDIAGTVESIYSINKELLMKCYNTFYNPSNMVLFIVGDLSFDKIIEVVENSEKKFNNSTSHIKRIFPIEPNSIKEHYIETKMDVSLPLFYLGFKDQNLGIRGDKAIKKDIVTNMILDVLLAPSGEFFNKLYEEGLIDNNFGAYFSGKETYGHSLIVGQSGNPQLVKDKVIELFSRPMESLISKDAFHRIKQKNIGNFLMGLNSIEFIANNFIDLYFDDFILLDYYDVINNITIDDLNNRLKEHFKPEMLTLSVVKP